VYKKITGILLTVVILVGIVFTGVTPVSAEASEETLVVNATETPAEGSEETPDEPDEPDQGTTEEPSGPAAFTVSQECIQLLKYWEGFCEKPYWDYGQYTVGYGTRCPDDKVAYYTQNGITEAEAEALLCTYLRQFESYLNNDLIKKYDLTLTQNQFDALLLLSYNCGPNWLYSESSSNLRKAVVSGVTGSEMVDRFSRWCNAGGQIQTYLLRRRLCEANIYLNGVYSQVVPEEFGYVLYDANGGKTSTSVQGFDVNETATIIPKPTYEGYVFGGWYTDRTGGEKVTVLDAKVRNARLYAHWTNQSGGSIDPDEEINGTKVTVDTEVLLIRQGPNTSYAIVGSFLSGDQVVITETAVGGNYTWGKCSKGWICLKYTDYDSVVEDNKKDEEEEETPDLQEHKMGTVRVSSCLYIRQGPSTGYGIVGQLYNGDRVKILEQKVAGPMVWGKIESGWISMEYVELDPEEEPEPPVTEPEPEKYSYTLTYYANYEGAKPSAKTDSESVADSPEATVVFKVDSNSFVREGYTFAGWATSADGEAVYQADAEITLNKDAASKSLYATWTKNAETPEPEPPVVEPDPEPVTVKGKVKVNSYLIVRSGPDSSYKAVATLSNNTPVTILEQKTTGSMTWGKIAAGWICMDYVVLEETPDAPAVTVKGTVNVSSFLRVRSQAGTNYTIVGYLYPNDRVEILEQKTVGGAVWGKISTGWVDLSYITLDEQPSTPSVPSTPSTPSTPSAPEAVIKTVNTECLHVRSQASTGSSIVGYVYYGAKVTITEQKTVNGTMWGKISSGWICMAYVK